MLHRSMAQVIDRAVSSIVKDGLLQSPRPLSFAFKSFLFYIILNLKSVLYFVKAG